MQKRWLYFMAAAVAGMCACGGGGGGEKPASSPEAAALAETDQSEEETDSTAAESRGAESGTKTEESRKTDKKDTEEKDGEAEPQGEGEYGDFRTGSWDGLTFGNPWLGITITFPEGSRVFSPEDMTSMVGENSGILINGQEGIDVPSQASEALNIYDLMVTMPDGRSSVQLAYMNAKKVDPDREISAQDCLREMKEGLSSIGDMGYETGEIEKTEIAGKEFDRFEASLMGGALYQEYYAFRAGDYVAVLTVSYEEQSREAVKELIEGIAAADR